MLINISHESQYDYDAPVPFGLQQLRLTPRSIAGQEVRHWSTTIEGAKTEVEYLDHHLNQVQLISFISGGSTIKVTNAGTVETSDSSGVFADAREHCPIWLFHRTTDLTMAGKGIKKLTASVTESPNSLGQLHELSGLVSAAIEYRSGGTHSGSTAEDALRIGSGVCQDHAHAFIASARLLGYPARYVSGYLVLDDQVNQEASHAWAEAFIPDLGWVGFDVSNGISPDERYVRIASGLDYSEAAPISGIRFGDADEQLQVSLQVQQ